MRDFRCFAPATRAIEVAWCGDAISGDKWRETGKNWGTNTSPRQVQNTSGLLGVKKPGSGRIADNPHLAATEKIVADLAFQLGLPVPPVTLWDCGDGRGGSCHAAVSAWAFQSALTWEQAKGFITPAQAADLVPAMSAMVPFEAWIDAQDRQNGGNVLIGSEVDGRPIAAWIDYAFSLDYVWKGNQKAACVVPPHYPPFGQPAKDMMIEVADRIAAMENATIEQIVNRIPAECLSRESAASICSNLRARQPAVRALW